MTVTNTGTLGSGIRIRNAKVELLDVALKRCDSHALLIAGSVSVSTVVATRCEFSNNFRYGAAIEGILISATFNNCIFHSNQIGIYGSHSTIHLRGNATAVHSNGDVGIYSCNSGSKVLIHLPSHHNTIYNNEREDRRANTGATITNVEDEEEDN